MSRSHAWTEFAVFVGCFSFLGVAVPPLLLSATPSLWLAIVVEAILLTVAFDLAELLTALCLSECDLPKLDRLQRQPSVAILFLVCDDVVPSALFVLGRQARPGVDVFVLDDSRNPLAMRLLDALPLRIVRRPDRAGYKAGNVNYWLRQHGAAYDYFLLLDTDSVVPADFVDEILRYAEHPANADVAIFNSLAACANATSTFARLMTVCTPLRNWLRLRLANRFPSVFSAGHNNLHRTSAILAVGGFDERFVAEDVALTLRLVKKGWRSKLVALTAFESEPTNVFSYVRRLTRWARQTLQVLRADWRGVPFLLEYQMFRHCWAYLSFVIYPLTAVVAAWYGRPAPAHAAVVWTPIFSGLMLLSLLPAFVRVPLLVARRISLWDYARSYVLSAAIAWCSMLRICAAAMSAAAQRGMAFDVTDKRDRPVTLLALFRHQCHVVPFCLFLAFGFWIRGTGAGASMAWLALFAAAPIVVYVFADER